MKQLKQCTKCKRWFDYDALLSTHYAKPVQTQKYCTGGEFVIWVAKPDDVDAIEYSREIAEKTQSMIGYDVTDANKTLNFNNYQVQYTWTEFVQFVLKARQELLR